METKNDQHLNVNNSLFSFKGTIGRLWYLTNSIYIIVSVGLVWGATSLLLVKSLKNNDSPQGSGVDLAGVLFGSSMIVGVLAIMLVALSLHVRRIRDIRGSTENEWVWLVCTVVLMLIPWLGLIPTLFLLLKQGVVTRPDTATPLDQLKDQIFGNSSSKSSQKSSDATSALKDLAYLHKSGSLTDNEFQEAKERILKKVS